MGGGTPCWCEPWNHEALYFPSDFPPTVPKLLYLEFFEKLLLQYLKFSARSLISTAHRQTKHPQKNDEKLHGTILLLLLNHVWPTPVMMHLTLLSRRLETLHVRDLNTRADTKLCCLTENAVLLFSMNKHKHDASHGSHPSTSVTYVQKCKTTREKLQVTVPCCIVCRIDCVLWLKRSNS